MVRWDSLDNVIKVFEDHPVYCTLPCGRTCSQKIFICENPRIPNWNWSYPYVDVFRAPNPYSDVYYSDDEIGDQVDIIFPPKRVHFGGLAVNAPCNVNRHLVHTYGEDYNETCKANSYNHAIESVKANVGKEAMVPCKEVLRLCAPNYNDFFNWTLNMSRQSPKLLT